MYKYVQGSAELKHENKWIIPKWESKTILPEWDDFLLNVMENDELSADKHTPIHYLLRKYEAPTKTDDPPAGLKRLEVRSL